MAENDKESEWISRARQGDDDAFACLVEVYQVPVYNLCYRMLGDAARAEEAAQETFLKAFRGLGRYDPARRFVTWLLSIASYHCIDQLRRRRVLTLAFDDLLPSQEKPDPSPEPEASLVVRETQEDIRGLLQHLGSKDRAAVVLRFWYDMSYEEIAQTLSLSVSSVKSRLYRARRVMARSWLDKESMILTHKGKTNEASIL